MIEFRGTYYQKVNDKSVIVLVQFDGVLLHVWHQSDPFYRILSCDAFQIAASLTNGQRCIKLPNGDRIQTDDIPAMNSLSQCYAQTDPANTCLLRRPGWMVAMLSSISIILAVWWVSRYGFPF